MIDKHLVQDVCSDAICPYCGERITDGQMEQLGGSFLHTACYHALGRDLDVAAAWEPSEDDLEYAYPELLWLWSFCGSVQSLRQRGTRLHDVSRALVVR